MAAADKSVILPKSGDHSKHDQKHSANDWIWDENENCAELSEHALDHHYHRCPDDHTPRPDFCHSNGTDILPKGVGSITTSLKAMIKAMSERKIRFCYPNARQNATQAFEQNSPIYHVHGWCGRV